MKKFEDELFAPGNPMPFRVWATIVHLIIFILGVFGNLILVIVVFKTKQLRTSTYCYLVSLAFADILVLLSAVPDGIVQHHVGTKWFTGRVGCSLMVFTNFLGINAGSLSILGFTIDRYVAAQKPHLVLRFCTWKSATKVVIGLWTFSVLYCAPWLGLTHVTADRGVPECQPILEWHSYAAFFITDMVLFYVIPLVVAAVVFTQLGLILKRSIKDLSVMPPPEPAEFLEPTLCQTKTEMLESSPALLGGKQETENSASRYVNGFKYGPTPRPSLILDDREQDFRKVVQKTELVKTNHHKLVRSRTRVFRTLVIIVVLFAITWLPYRGVLVYNSLIANVPWLNVYFLFFAKTAIFFNCAMNPYLYNFMSRRFRYACFRLMCLKSDEKK